MLLDLPSECVLRVLKELPVADVVCTGCCCSALRALVADDAFWRDLAEAKWGSAVHELKPLADADAQQRSSSEGSDAAACHTSDQLAQSAAVAANTPEAGSSGSWQRYCCKRMSLKPIRCSPLSLLQEAYPDPWMHITCCVLCSRTSGSATIRCCIARFFEAWPTPTACLQGCPRAMAGLLHPLGLTQARLAAVRAVAQGFLGSDWQDPSEFKGCGKFVADSWRILCKGTRDVKGVDDAKLKQYLAWVARQQQPASDQDAAQSLPAAAAAAAAGGCSSKQRQRAASSTSSRTTRAGKDQEQLQQCKDALMQQQDSHAAVLPRRTRSQAKAAEATHAAAQTAKRRAKHSGTVTTKNCMPRCGSSKGKQIDVQPRRPSAVRRAGGERGAAQNIAVH